MIELAIINKSPHAMPAYATPAAAGMDVRAWLPEGPLTLGSLARALVPTGLYIALPVGYEAQLRPRSGLAYKEGVTLLNSPGTIDADYRGEIKVLVVNFSSSPVSIADGDRVAQLVVAAHAQVVWQQVEALPSTTRGEGGFGSTGRN